MIAGEKCRGQEKFVGIDICVYVFKVGKIVVCLMLMGMNLQKGKN